MKTKVNLDSAYIPSEDVVAREIEGELIIVPLVAGIGDMEDELFTLNETGREIWNRLDGKRTLSDIVKELSVKFEQTAEGIEMDVIGFAEGLLKRGILVEATTI